MMDFKDITEHPKFEWFNERGGLLYLIGIFAIVVGVTHNDTITTAIGVLDIVIGFVIYYHHRQERKSEDDN